MLLATTAVSYAQFFRNRGGGGRTSQNRSDYPMWDIPKPFQHDTFTFCRIQFDSRGGRWTNDYPDSDWNFSYRLQQLTSLKVDPNAKVMRLTDEGLNDYPFIFLSLIHI